MTAFNPVQKNAFFATKHLLTLMGVNIRAKALTDLLVSSRDFPSLASIVETLEMLKIKNLPVSLKEEQLQEIPLPAIAQLTIDGDIFVPVRKIDKQIVEWCHEKKGWQREPLTEFNKKWNGILLLVDDNSAFYAKKEFSNKPNFFAEYASIILCVSAFVCIAYF
jgi:ABC-type bacteriocin/lantibiotic exporter with double-glycine peptidase domain